MPTSPLPPSQRSNGPRRAAGWLLLLCALAWSGVQLPARVAFAQASKDDLAKAEAKALQAKFKFKAEAYAEAAELFLEAFTISKSPALLFNAARAFEEARRYKEARAAFEQYLGLPGLSDAGRADARAHLQTCEAKIAEAASATPAGSATPPGSATPTGSAAAPGDATPPATTPPPTEAPSTGSAPAPGAGAGPVDAGGIRGAPAADPPSKLLTWSLIGGGGLLVLMSAAGYAGSVARAQAANDMDFSVDSAKARYNTEFDAAESGIASSTFLLVVGAGLAGWGTWRLLRAPDNATAARAPSFWGAPTAFAGERGVVGGLALGGSY